MAKTNIELYEALSAPVGDEAEIADLRAEMHREFSSMKGWLLATMVPFWLGVYGGLVTMIVHLSRG